MLELTLMHLHCTIWAGLIKVWRHIVPTAISVANWFVNNLCDRESGSVVTHLQVQKMLYFAQAWHMMVLDTPLFEEDMEAWPHGPVVPSVWQKFKQYGWDPIQPGGDSTGISKESENVLIQVLDAYGAFGAKRLEAMAHAERPWIDARGNLAPEERCNAIIEKNAILAYYKQVYGEFESAEEPA